MARLIPIEAFKQSRAAGPGVPEGKARSMESFRSQLNASRIVGRLILPLNFGHAFKRLGIAQTLLG